MLEIIAKWLAGYSLVMLVMCIDNIFWISASPSKEYEDFKKMNFYKKMRYIWNFRIKTVLTNWRDICPAIIGGFIASFVL